MSTRMTLRSGSSQTASSNTQEAPIQAPTPKPQQIKSKKPSHTTATESTDESAPPSPSSQSPSCDGTAGDRSPESSLEPFSLNLSDLESLESQRSHETETAVQLSETQIATTSSGTDGNHTATVPSSAHRNDGSDTRETPTVHMAEKESENPNSEVHQTPDSCMGAGTTCTDTACPGAGEGREGAAAGAGAGTSENAEEKTDLEFDFTLDSTNSSQSTNSQNSASAHAHAHTHAQAHAHPPNTDSVPLASNNGSVAPNTDVCRITDLSQNTRAALCVFGDELDRGLFANALRRTSAGSGLITSSVVAPSSAPTPTSLFSTLQARMSVVVAREEKQADVPIGSDPAATDPALPSTHSHPAVRPADAMAAQILEQDALQLKILETRLSLAQLQQALEQTNSETPPETISNRQTEIAQLRSSIAGTVQANRLLFKRLTGTAGEDYAAEHLVARASESTLSNVPGKGICLAAAFADGWHLAKTGRHCPDTDIINLAFSLTMSVKALLKEWQARLAQTGSIILLLAQLNEECLNTTADADSLLKAKNLRMFIELTMEIVEEQKLFNESCNDTATSSHAALSLEWVQHAHQRFEHNIELLKTGAGGVSYYLDADTEGVFFAASLGVRTEIYAAGRGDNLRNAVTLLKRGTSTVRIAVEKLHFRVVRLCADVTVRLTFPHRILDQFDVPSAVVERVSDCSWGQEKIAKEMASRIQQNNLAQVRSQPPPRTTSAAVPSAAAATGPAPRPASRTQANTAQAAVTSTRASGPATLSTATPAKERRAGGQHQAASTPSVVTAAATVTHPAPQSHAQPVSALDSLTQRMNESAAISAAESLRVSQAYARFTAEIQALRSQLQAPTQTPQTATAPAAAATAPLPRFTVAGQHTYADHVRLVMGDSRAQTHHSRRQSYQSDDQQPFNSEFTELRRRRIQSVTAVFKMHRSSKHRLPDNEEQLKRALADALPDSRARFVRYLGNERHLALVRFESHDQAMCARNTLETDQSVFELREDRGPNQP